MKTKLLVSLSLIFLFLISNSVPAQWLTKSTSRIEKLDANAIQNREKLEGNQILSKPNPNINNLVSGDVLTTNPRSNIQDNRAIIYVVPNQGSSSGNGRAPQGSRLFNNTKYLIKGSEMTASGFTGAVTSVGWGWNNPSGAGAPVAQSVTTTGNLRVYLKDTVAGAVTMGGTFIDTNGVGYTKVIDGTITIPAGISAIDIDVPVGGPGTSSFTPTPGNGVLVIYVYKTTTALATPLGSPTVNCDASSAGTLLTFQSQTGGGSVGTSSAFRPSTRFGNALVEAITVGPIWALGQMNVCPCPDTNFVDVIFSHERAQLDTIIINTTIKNVVGGGTKFAYVDTVITNQVGLFALFRSYPKNTDIKKMDSIIAVGRVTGSEDVTGNNRATYLKKSTLNTYSNPQPNGVYDGRVGLGTPGDFVAGYYLPCSVSLAAVKIVFNQAQFRGQEPYLVKVWGTSGDTMPSASPIYTSAQLISPAGGASPQPVTHYLPSPITVGPGYFYVGVTELDSNLGIGYQFEDPIRPGTFFFQAPANSNTWIDLFPGNPFNIDIEAITTMDLTLGVWLQGYYVPPSPAVNSDTVTLIAHSFSPPYTAIESSTGIAGTNGLASFKFARLDNNVDYYFELRNRNHLETWTANTGVKIDECGKLYDMTQSASSAFGSNMYLQLPEPSRGSSVFTIYGGDVDQDGFINGIDVGAVFNASSAFVTGRSVYDINGDEIVDLTDLTITFNNNTAFVSAVRP